MFFGLNKKGGAPMSDNTSVIYMDSRSTSMVDQTMSSNKKVVMPKLNLDKLISNKKEDVDKVEIKIEINDENNLI